MNGPSDTRKSMFKNAGKTTEMIRRNREGTSVEIRKQKREDSFAKRRNNIEDPPTNESATTVSSMDSDEEILEKIQNTKQGLYSNNLEECLESVKLFRRVLSREKTPYINIVIEHGVVPRFIELLGGVPDMNRIDPAAKKTIETIQFESAWALTNIAAGTPDNTKTVINAGGIELFVRMLSGGNDEIADQCAWALGNIAGDSSKTRDQVNNAGGSALVIKKIYEIFNSPTPNAVYLRNLAWTLSNMVRGKPTPEFETISPIVPVFVALLTVNDTEILSDVCWGLSYVTDGNRQFVDCVISNNAIPGLIMQLSSENSSIQSAALRAIGNIVSGNDEQTQKVVEAGFLNAAVLLLHSRKTTIVKECCWAISNITAGTKPQIQSFIDSGLVPQILFLLSTADFKIRKEACWAVSNATAIKDNDVGIISALVEHGAIKSLCSILGSNDSKIILVALDGISNILDVGDIIAPQTLDGENMYAVEVEECGGLDSITELQEHKNHSIYEKCKGIIDRYFGKDDSELYGSEKNSVFGFESEMTIPDTEFDF